MRFGSNVIVRISAFAAPSPPLAAPSPPPFFAAVLPRCPKYRLSVNGIVNSNPPRTLSIPRDAPCSVAVLVFVTCSDSVWGE